MYFHSVVGTGSWYWKLPNEYHNMYKKEMSRTFHNEFQQRALSSAVWAHQRDLAALVDLQRQITKQIPRCRGLIIVKKVKKGVKK